MINNSFLYQCTEGDYWRLWSVKTDTLIFFRSLAEWGGGFLYKVPYNICSLDFQPN